MRALRVPGFGLLLAGEAVNATGNWVAVIAIWGFAAFRFDAGAADLALLLVALSAPGVLLGPPLGVLIDRLGPRRALILADAGGFLNALALTQADSYAMVILLALPLGLVEALGSASVDALPPRLVADGDLPGANALLTAAQDVALIAGPVIAAIVHARWGLAGAFLADAATFLVGMAVVLPLDVGPAESDGGGRAASSPWDELREGVNLARRAPALRWTLVLSATTFSLWALFAVLEPLYVRDVLGRSDTVFALFQTVFGVGLVGGGAALAVLGDRLAQPRHVAFATIASGLTALAYLATRSVAVAVLALLVWGVEVAFFLAPAKTLLQRGSPLAAHGRILSLHQALEPLAAMAASPFGAVLVGLIGVQWAGAAGGVLAGLAGLVALRKVPRLGPETTPATPLAPSP